MIRQGLGVDANSWRGHYELARALFGQNRAEEAEASAVQTLPGGSDFAPLYLLLGNIHIQKHDYAALKQDMETYLKLDPNGPASEQAHRILTAIVASPVESRSTPPVNPGQLPQSAALASPTPTTRVAALDSRPWPPPELVEAKLLAGTQPPCSLTQVLQSASQRVKELAGDLQSITATETIEHRQVDKAGTAGPPKATTFNYLFSITEVRPGILSVEEMRNGNLAAGDFPTSTATTGLPAIAMIFHPFYISDFDMTCEGMTQWRGQPAWLVRFEQRKGVPGRIYSFRADGLSFAVSLRGRAWIAASNYQILRLVTELAEPIAKISLHTVSLAIEYQPVLFHVKGKQLWLPAVAEAYLDFLGHRYYQRHTFRGYVLFAVDTFQKIENPRQQP